jgi:hypothetical protein
MMPSKRFITVKDGTGKKLYEGEDKRVYDQNYPVCALGIPISDWIKAGVYTLGVIIIMVRLQFQVDDLVKVSSSFKQYMESADSFNSSVYGTMFRGGAPVDGAYRTKKDDSVYNRTPLHFRSVG